MLATLLMGHLALGIVVPAQSAPQPAVTITDLTPDSGRTDTEADADFVVCHQSQCESRRADHENYMDLGCTTGGAGVFGLLGLIPLLAARRP